MWREINSITSPNRKELCKSEKEQAECLLLFYLVKSD
jgi:hypothetical protein